MECFYVGDRQKAPNQINRCQKGDMVGRNLDIDKSLKVWRHSPSGFEWGYGGSGPAQTALAILLDYTGDEKLAAQLHQEFKREKVGPLGDRWIITSGEIDRWLEKHGVSVGS